MKSLTLFTAATALLLTVGCAKKEEPVVQKPTATASPFVPAASGQVTPLQIKFWNKANTELNTLVAQSGETLNAKDSTEYKSAFETYSNTRDRICKKHGLSGGYKEYLWISKNISKAVNRPLLDSLKIKTL